MRGFRDGQFRDEPRATMPDWFGPAPWRLNLGCGFNRRPGFIGVDREIAAEPGLVMDVEQPWPIPEGSVSEIIASHVVEHLHDLKTFFQETYRVMIPGASMAITVPHHCSDFFWGDPTHVRPITELTLMLLSRKACDECRRKGFSNTPLAVYWSVDFETDDMQLAVSDGWKGKVRTAKEVQEAIVSFNNVVSEVTFLMRRV